MATTEEPNSPTLDAPTDPLMGRDEQQLRDESRPGDRLALYTALVRLSQTPYPDLDP